MISVVNEKNICNLLIFSFIYKTYMKKNREEMKRIVKDADVDNSVRAQRVQDETAVCRVSSWWDCHFAKRETSEGSHFYIY